MDKHLKVQIIARVEDILEERVSRSDTNLVDILLDIGEKTAPTLMWRTPMVLSSFVVDTIVHFRETVEKAREKDETITFLPPEGFVEDFFTRCTEAESSLIRARGPLSIREKGMKLLGALKRRIREKP